MVFALLAMENWKYGIFFDKQCCCFYINFKTIYNNTKSKLLAGKYYIMSLPMQKFAINLG